MRQDRHVGRGSHFEQQTGGSQGFYQDWHDEDEGLGNHNHHYRSGNNGRRVGRSDQVTSSSSNPRRHNNAEEEDTTGDGSSSVVSFSSGYARQSATTGNNRTNYHEPTVRVHYVGHPAVQGEEYYHPPGYHPSVVVTRMPDIPERFRDEKDESEMYVTDSTFRKQRPPGSIYSHYSGKSRPPSEMSSVKTKTSRNGGVVVETMAAPNPFCPNTKGVCCLMVLVNLGLILVTLGFSIVLQLFEPPFVWYCGIAFLIVGFIGLIASLIFCVHLCRESREIRRAAGREPGELYWTHHWQKRIPIPGMGGTRGEKDDISNVYSGRNDYPDQNQPDVFHSQNEREGRGVQQSRNMTPIHSYRN